jgi:TPR repeat protein
MWGTDEQRLAFGAIYRLWHGEPDVRDRGAAVKALTALVDQGYAPAQYALGMAYYDGEGVGRDDQKAFVNLLAAATQHYPAAENMIGSFYGAVSPRHDVCPHDPAEAARWYRRSADHGHSAGMFNYAQSASSGLGVERDQAEAYVWASLAVRCSTARSRPAEVLRDRAAADLDPQRRRDADARIGALAEGLPHPWSEPLLYWRHLSQSR